MEIVVLKPCVVGKLIMFFRDVKWGFNASWGFKGTAYVDISILKNIFISSYKAYWSLKKNTKIFKSTEKD